MNKRLNVSFLWEFSARCWLNALRLSSFLFGSLFVLNGYFNDNGFLSRYAFLPLQRDKEEKVKVKGMEGWRKITVWVEGRGLCEEGEEVNHVFSCHGHCKLLLFALVENSSIWRMDWDGFGISSLLWDVTTSGSDWELVYLTRADQVGVTEESSHWKW